MHISPPADYRGKSGVNVAADVWEIETLNRESGRRFVTNQEGFLDLYGGHVNGPDGNGLRS